MLLYWMSESFSFLLPRFGLQVHENKSEVGNRIRRWFEKLRQQPIDMYAEIMYHVPKVLVLISISAGSTRFKHSVWGMVSNTGPGID